jgi:hypothetical protein
MYGIYRVNGDRHRTGGFQNRFLCKPLLPDRIAADDLLDMADLPGMAVDPCRLPIRDLKCPDCKDGGPARIPGAAADHCGSRIHRNCIAPNSLHEDWRSPAPDRLPIYFPFADRKSARNVRLVLVVDAPADTIRLIVTSFTLPLLPTLVPCVLASVRM